MNADDHPQGSTLYLKLIHGPNGEFARFYSADCRTKGSVGNASGDHFASVAIGHMRVIWNRMISKGMKSESHVLKRAA